MTAQLAPTPIFKGWDNNGFPLAFGFLTTYAAGTTTPQATYVDSTQTTQNQNPQQLNFRGEMPLWLNPLLAYKFLLTDIAGNIIPGWPVDNIQGGISVASNIVPSQTNTFTLGTPTITFANGYFGPNGAPVLDPVSGNIGYYARTAAEIAASVTPTNYVYAPTPLIDVRRYGWATGNTAAQNATALNSAIAVSQATVTGSNYGATIQLPPGSYAIAPVTVPAYTIIRGTGQRSTILQWTSGGANTLFTLGGTSGTLTNSPGLSDLSVQLTGTAGTIALLQGTVHAEVSRLYLEGETVSSGRTTAGVIIDGSNASSFFNRVSDVECNHLHYGFQETTTGSQQPTQNYFYNCNGSGDVGTDTTSIGLSVGNGASVQGSGQATVYVACDFESYGTGAHFASLCGNTVQVGTRFEGNTTIGDILLDNNSGPQVWFGAVYTTVVNNTGFLLNQYIGGVNGSYAPIPNQLVPTQFSANSLTDVPITVEAFTAQTGDVVQYKNASNVVVGAVTANHQYRLVKGISVTSTTSNNLRGTATFAAQTSAAVSFATAEPDASYQVTLGQTASSTSPPWITAQGTGGFTINFSANFTGNVFWHLFR